MKIAIISGASAGIGAETAAMLADDGWKILCLSRRPSPVPSAIHIRCDFADPSSLAAACAALGPALDGAQRVLLVHNASLLQNDRAGEVDTETFTRIMQINLIAPNALNSVVLPRMPAGSAVVYVGSTLSEKAVPNAYSYVTSKHATIGMMRATCQDLVGRGIHTACVCPGFTDTEMLRSHIGTDPDTEAAVASQSAFGRLIRPEEIAETIIWAANHPVINGAVLHANLGQVER